MAYVGESVVGLRVVGVAVFGVCVLGAEALSMPTVRAVHTRCSDCVSRNDTHRIARTIHPEPPPRTAASTCASRSGAVARDPSRCTRDPTTAYVGDGVVGLSVVGLSVVGLSVVGLCKRKHYRLTFVALAAGGGYTPQGTEGRFCGREAWQWYVSGKVRMCALVCARACGVCVGCVTSAGCGRVVVVPYSRPRAHAGRATHSLPVPASCQRYNDGRRSCRPASWLANVNT
jgi:hypothetical protein